MNWLPFIFGLIILCLFVTSIVVFIDRDSYRNWVKKQHQSPFLILFLLSVGLCIPFVSMVLQNM